MLIMVFTVFTLTHTVIISGLYEPIFLSPARLQSLAYFKHHFTLWCNSRKWESGEQLKMKFVRRIRT